MPNWSEVTQIPEARWIIFGTLLLFLVLIAIYVSTYFRNLAIGGSESEDLDLLSEFRNLRDQGHLDNDEYNRLKTVVPENAKHELLRGTGTDEQRQEIDKPEKKKFLTLAEAESLKNSTDDPTNTTDQQKADSE